MPQPRTPGLSLSMGKFGVGVARSARQHEKLSRRLKSLLAGGVAARNHRNCEQKTLRSGRSARTSQFLVTANALSHPTAPATGGGVVQ
jgi:hypothetical protein